MVLVLYQLHLIHQRLNCFVRSFDTKLVRLVSVFYHQVLLLLKYEVVLSLKWFVTLLDWLCCYGISITK